MYLSRREANVFVLEGTSGAGVSAACTYAGSAKEEDILRSKSFSLLAEVKATSNTGEVLVLLDTRDISDLSSGCDFLCIKISFGKRELRIENRRKKSRESETFFVLPNCNMLRPNSYVTLQADISDDTLCYLTLNGVVVVRNIFLGRTAKEGRSVGHKMGLATSGRSRVYVKKFRIEEYKTNTTNGSTHAKDSGAPPLDDFSDGLKLALVDR